MGVAGRNDREHADAQIEDVLHLVVGHVSGRLDLPKDARFVPATARDDGVDFGRHYAHEVGGDATAGDMAQRPHVRVAAQLEQRGRVDDARREELFAE